MVISSFCLDSKLLDKFEKNVFVDKWPDKSATSYDMLDFKSYLKNL